MELRNAVVLTQIIGFGVFLWVGLYLLVRATIRSQLVVVGVAALFGQALFFLAGALTDTARDPATFVAVERWTWWTAVLPVAAWFHFSSLCAQIGLDDAHARGRVARMPLVLLVYAAGLLIALLGTTTELFGRYSQAALELPPGPAYALYIAYQVLVNIGALLNLLRALKHAPHGLRAHQLRLMVGGAGLFLLGGLVIAVSYNSGRVIPVFPGFLAMFVGLAVLAYGVAHYGALLEGQDIRRDFFYNLTGIVVLNLVYGSLLALTTPVSAAGLLALVGLVTVTHTAFDSGRWLWDGLFFSRAEQDARADARGYATNLGTTPVEPAIAPLADPADLSDPDDLPDPDELAEAETSRALATVAADHASEAPAGAQEEQAPGMAAEQSDEQSLKAFKSAVRRALTNLKNPPQLARSPLLTLAIVDQRMAEAGLADNRLNRVAVLRELLIEQIEALRPSDSVTSKVGDAWRFYNVLYYPYVRELSQKGALHEASRLREERRRRGQQQPDELEQVLTWVADVNENTYFRWQRSAAHTIALILWEENAKLSGQGREPAASGQRMLPAPIEGTQEHHQG